MMRLSAIAFAATALLVGAAQAQTSSVQIYGMVDLSLRSTNHQGATGDDTLNSVTSGGIGPSRLGFNITEDLGGGLKAIANMEHRFVADTGMPESGTFWPQSWVGLQSDSWGRITLGRQYNVLFDVTAGNFSSFKTIGPFMNSYKPEISMALGARNDNQVKYALNVGDFGMELQWSPDEKTAFSPTNGESFGGMAKYSFGPVVVGGGYLQRDDGNNHDAKAYLLGVGYQSGPLYLNAQFAQNKFDNGLDTSVLLIGSGSENLVTFSSPLQSKTTVNKRTMWTFGGTYAFTPALQLGAQYWNLNQSYYTANAPKSKGNFYSVLLDYAFSKRTDVYTGLEYTKLKNLQMTNTATGAGNGAENRTTFLVGIRHKF